MSRGKACNKKVTWRTGDIEEAGGEAVTRIWHAGAAPSVSVPVCGASSPWEERGLGN